MIASFLLAVVSIAFPQAGQKLPYVKQCYMIGATDGGETNLVIQGKNVPVYRTGAWMTMVDCAEGVNHVDVAGSNHVFTVMRKPSVVSRMISKVKNRAPGKVWKKLEYAGDFAKPHPSLLTPRPSPSEMTVVIDAGHGGQDTGALSPHSYWEKDANLLMAKAVRDELAGMGYRVVMTREDDRSVKLYDRPKVAHENDAVAFISIHHNAPPHDRDPQRFRYHAVFAWNEIGERLAKAINARMSEAFGTVLSNNGVQHANYAVTRNPEIPSCLIEVDFITTPEGEADCWDPARRARVAKSIAQGFADWCR